MNNQILRGKGFTINAILPQPGFPLLTMTAKDFCFYSDSCVSLSLNDSDLQPPPLSKHLRET